MCPEKTVGIQNLQNEYGKNIPNFIATELTVKASRNAATDLFLTTTRLQKKKNQLEVLHMHVTKTVGRGASNHSACPTHQLMQNNYNHSLGNSRQKET